VPRVYEQVVWRQRSAMQACTTKHCKGGVRRQLRLTTNPRAPGGGAGPPTCDDPRHRCMIIATIGAIADMMKRVCTHQALTKAPAPTPMRCISPTVRVCEHPPRLVLERSPEVAVWTA